MPKVVSHVRKSPPKPAKPPRASAVRRLTAAEVAREYGVSDQAVSAWKAAGAPFGPDGRTTLNELRRWELAATKAAAEAKAAPTTEDEAKARKAAAEAQIKELELAKMLGQMVRVEDAAAAYTERLGRLLAVVASVPGTYVHRVVGLERESDAQRVLRDLQAELRAALQPPSA